MGSNLKLPPPNRLAVYLTSMAALLTAVAPAVANLDTTSTAGLVAGLLGIVAVVSRWLEGWQQHEERSARPDAPGGGSGGLSPERVAAVREAVSAATNVAVLPLEGPPALNVRAEVPPGEPGEVVKVPS